MMNYLIIPLILSIGTNDKAITCGQSINSADFRQALLICESDLNNSNKNTSGELLLKLISITHEMDLDKKNQFYLDQLKNSSEFHESPKLQYEWFRWNGMNEFHSGKLDSSKQYFLETLSIAILSNNQEWIAKSNNDLGVLANHRQEFKKALSFYKKSLDINIQENNNYLAGKAYTNIGTVYQHLEEYNSAINHYKLALKAYLNYKNIPDYDKSVIKHIKHAYESLLQVNLIIEDYKVAEYYAQLVIENSPEQMINLEKIPSIVNFAKLYVNEEHYQLASYFLNKALKISKQTDLYFMNEIEYQYALLYRKQGLNNLAIQSALKGLNLTSPNDYLSLAKFYLLTSELTENNAEESLNFLKKHQLYREKLLEQKYDSDIKTIQHNSEKKQIVSELKNERNNRVSSEIKMKSMNNNFISVTVTLIIIVIATIIFSFIKKKEKQLLLSKIKSHEQADTVIKNETKQVLFVDEVLENIDKGIFCEYLVKTMNKAVNIWEKNTATNRTELADQSGIWTISNDDGTLRTRSMDKYLSVDKIPKNPRWRNVVRTCHFILSDQKVCQEDRKELEHNLSNILNYFQKLNAVTTTK